MATKNKNEGNYEPKNDKNFHFFSFYCYVQQSALISRLPQNKTKKKVPFIIIITQYSLDNCK